MSQPSAVQHVYAVLIALQEDTLLLPNAAIAEVTSQDALLPPAAGAPAWLIGWYPFDGRRVPVISFEMLNGAPSPPSGRRARVVIVHSLGTHYADAQIAFLTQGYPHLVTLNRTALQSIPLRDTDRSDLLLSRVRISSQEAVIPDLETVEADLARVGAP